MFSDITMITGSIEQKDSIISQAIDQTNGNKLDRFVSRVLRFRIL
jgi:hypothetical protein